MERGRPEEDASDTGGAAIDPHITVDELLRQPGGSGEAGWQFIVGEPEDVGIADDAGIGGGDGDG